MRDKQPVLDGPCPGPPGTETPSLLHPLTHYTHVVPCAHPPGVVKHPGTPPRGPPTAAWKSWKQQDRAGGRQHAFISNANSRGVGKESMEWPAPRAEQALCGVRLGGRKREQELWLMWGVTGLGDLSRPRLYQRAAALQACHQPGLGDCWPANGETKMGWSQQEQLLLSLPH